MEKPTPRHEEFAVHIDRLSLFFAKRVHTPRRVYDRVEGSSAGSVFIQGDPINETSCPGVSSLWEASSAVSHKKLFTSSFPARCGLSPLLGTDGVVKCRGYLQIPGTFSIYARLDIIRYK